MNCKYFTVRSKQRNRYKFCRLNREIIEVFDCKKCDKREHRTYKKTKRQKSKRTKATEIPDEVKETVWNRDNRQCIFCKTPVDIFHANAHFIPRSQGGLGIEQNIFTACNYCHSEQDNGTNTKYYEELAEKHLRNKYENWNIQDLIYKKYKF